LDLVDAGATKMRTESARLLIDKIKIAILKGNIGEISVLAGVEGKVRGVDSWGFNGDPTKIAQEYAQQTGVTVAVSGAADIVTDGNRVVVVDNGHPMMDRLTGTGCMVASLVGAFTAVCSDQVTSSVAVFAAFGIAGERAAQKTSGPYSFRTALMDEIAALQPEDLMQNARVQSL
jgi:hydroxyethylthiazole kinase